MAIKDYHLILGSGSPRRRQLLHGLGLIFDVKLKDVPEEPPGELKRGEIALHLAEVKSAAYLNELAPKDLLITADTIVWIDNTLLGKPVDRDDAIRMLLNLQGRGHQVYTGVSLNSLEKQINFCVESTVWFNRLTEWEIEKYVDHYRPFDKAGAYGAQDCLPEGMNPCSKEEKEFLVSIGRPDLFERSIAMDSKQHIPIIERITGGYFNVMGLPLVELWRELVKF